MIDFECRGVRLSSSIGTEREMSGFGNLPSFLHAILVHEGSAVRDGIIPKSLAAGDSSGET